MVKTALLIGGLVALMPVAVLCAALGVRAETGDGADGGVVPAPTVGLDGIPALYLALFEEAAARFGLPWELLAAIGEIESDDGRNPDADIPNAAGAVGPMQFEPATFAEYSWAAGVSDPSIDSPHDAIEAAAAMLAANGAPHDSAAAIYAYNHADWYVTDVLNLAATYRRDAALAGPSSPVGAPG